MLRLEACGLHESVQCLILAMFERAGRQVDLIEMRNWRGDLVNATKHVFVIISSCLQVGGEAGGIHSIILPKFAATITLLLSSPLPFRLILV